MTSRRDKHAKLKGALAFLQHEAAAGLLLVGAALAALIVSNSPLEWLYERLLDTPVGRTIGIAISSLYSSDFKAFLADAMRIVESLQFDFAP